MSLYFPMFVDLTQKNILFVGAGKIALRRLVSIYDFAGSVTVVAPEAVPGIEQLADEGCIEFHCRRFGEEDLAGTDIAIIATGHAGTDARIADMCRRRGILVNVAGDSSLCDFYFPGIVRDDPVVVGVTACGEDHKLAAETAAKIREMMGQLDAD
ncbi:MAG: bifunctional precorrin-2 dehydrogenase/sirohydrochlorin ferrochelatase [Mogibacterium sp.]|nr:bifunctional precorrin-2 dehydrogenase/sirohydrochlorin ferrochelatase [Mogibacterium sp.]